MHIRLISLICYSQMAHIFITVMSSCVLVCAHMDGGKRQLWRAADKNKNRKEHGSKIYCYTTKYPPNPGRRNALG